MMWIGWLLFGLAVVLAKLRIDELQAEKRALRRTYEGLLASQASQLNDAEQYIRKHTAKLLEEVA